LCSCVDGVEGGGFMDFFFFLEVEEATEAAAEDEVEDDGLDFFFFFLLDDGFFAASTAPPRESSPANATLFLAPAIPNAPDAGGREADADVAARQHAAAAAEVTVIPFMLFGLFFTVSPRRCYL